MSRQSKKPQITRGHFSKTLTAFRCVVEMAGRGHLCCGCFVKTLWHDSWFKGLPVSSKIAMDRYVHSLPWQPFFEESPWTDAMWGEVHSRWSRKHDYSLLQGTILAAGEVSAWDPEAIGRNILWMILTSPPFKPCYPRTWHLLASKWVNGPPLLLSSQDLHSLLAMWPLFMLFLLPKLFPSLYSHEKNSTHSSWSAHGNGTGLGDMQKDIVGHRAAHREGGVAAP